MSGSQKLTLAGLLVLVGLAIAGLVFTSGSSRHAAAGQTALPPEVRALGENEQVLATAERLAPSAVSPEEQKLAQNASRIADREVDMAFTDALRLASEQASAPSGPARALEARIARLEAEIASLQDELKNLPAQQAHARGGRLVILQNRAELDRAQLSLDQDALADAHQDLARTGGTLYSQIQQLWQQHEAAQHSKESAASSSASASAPAAVPVSSSVIARWRAWRAVRGTVAALTQARAQATASAADLIQAHDRLERRVAALRSGKLAPSAAAASPDSAASTGANPAASASANAASARIALLQHLSLLEKNLTDLDLRATDLRELASIYGQWIGLAQDRAQSALHGLIQSALYILLTVLAVWLAGLLAEHAFNRIGLERRQLTTLRGMVRFCVEAFGLAAVLLLIFGVPRNLSTILGLAGAGLTVALKDFIVSFLGWFTLMGRRGVRVGDWVEINGVRGEVVEVSLLRTVLLETGNWTEPGHPTGRQVTFLNSYAVEGYYFNFTTAGQWLWDELALLIPWGVDPYPVIARIERVAAQETAETAKTAEAEWQRAARGHSVKAFTAAPAIIVRTLEDGIEVTVRYICRAKDRYDLRFRISNAAVKLIHEAKEAAGAASLQSAAEPG